MQYFHWYTSPGGTLWNELSANARWLADLGITSVWLPPACKASGGGYSVGYDVYDLFDLGEFDQKGTVAVKYGTKQQYQEAIVSLRNNSIKVISDIVLNHKAGGDETEKFVAVKVDPENRKKIIGAPEEIEAYTRFTFPGRGTQYSDFIWTYQCFTGVDFNVLQNETAVYSIQQEWGDDWEDMIDDEKGNYDYLMFNDIEFRNPAVRDELVKWGTWLMEQAPYDGVRLDAVKHISPKFYNEWLDRVRHETGKNIFAVGEYWAPGFLHLLVKYIEATEGRMSLFDSSLQHNFHTASTMGNGYDMRQIFSETLTAVMPDKSVTLVDNHDTQPLQALEAPVEKWFKPLAYALILLRQEGIPCIFYPDLFGASYKDNGNDGNEYEIFLDKIEELESLITLRKNVAYGIQKDYFDHANCIGWVREGDDMHDGCVVVLSNGDAGNKTMNAGARYAGRKFKDSLNKVTQEVFADGDGNAEFYCLPGSVSVWVAVS